MVYCKNCGHKLVEGHQFCAECGQAVEQNPVSSKAPQPESSAPQNGPAEKAAGMSKKTKAVAISVAAAAGLLFAGYYTVDKMMMSPEAVAENFVEAVQKKEVQKVKTFVNEGQIELSANDEQVKAFIEYLHKNPKMLSSIADGLDEESALYEKEGTDAKADEHSSPYATMNYDGKKWLVFNHFTIRVHPVYSEITSNVEKTEVYIDNKKIGQLSEADTEKNFGPFLPGEHKVKAAIKGDYGTVEAEQIVDSSEMDEEPLSIEFDWSNHYLSLYSDYEDATLFVNGKSTGKKIEDINALGPVAIDDSVKVHAERKFGSKTKKTPVVTVEKDTGELELYFGMSENMEVNSTVDETEEEWWGIEESIRGHYGSISNDNFATAYEAFSSSRQQKVNMNDWKKGLQANILDEVTRVEVTEIEGGHATAYIEMTSYDDKEDGSTLVQEWGGNWHLVKEDGRWKLNEADLEKLDSRVE
ncbi:hypothetical protein FZC66_17795 [Priestia megaterium]|nr:hypothetical protein FZC66_17795 [Priestia megaterium]